MSDTILDALVRLFALIGDIHDETVITVREKDIVRIFLERHLNNELVMKYMKMFDEYLGIYNSENIAKGSIKDRKRVSLNAMRILAICEQINEELRQDQKIYVLIQLMDFISLGEEITENELDFLQTVSDAFNVPAYEFSNIRSFIIGNFNLVADKSKLLLIDNIKKEREDGAKHIIMENITGKIAFLSISSTNTLILRYYGSEDLYLNGQNISAEQTYIFDRGSVLRGKGINTIYYSTIFSNISGASFKSRISLDAMDVTFKFRNSGNGIHNLDFHGESGELIGILGGSGVGKSTTLSILNGTLKPQDGKVLINGYNLYDEEERHILSGSIGFVPQDDLLIEELTVYQNIYFNARLCLNNLTEEELVSSVNKILTDFDLEDVRDLKVGNPLKKVISGGQRKRVNIALEMLREPTILFVDEPTSGLSSFDSEAVMNLLKEQTNKGKLVIINIHQPGSEIYKMFDKVMIIDRGGYPVYFGNPSEAIVYFKRLSKHANFDEDQCVKCGNVDTDQILQIIEARVVDEHGRATRTRKVTPVEWAERYKKNFQGKLLRKTNIKTKLPVNSYSIPGLIKQSLIFFTRDILSKLADKQYIIISLLCPPLLALLLAFFTRYTRGVYTFSENDNIAPFLFMCVLTSLFFGLLVSSNEILKDRKILKRESFLNLSWFSYLNSKMMILFLVSAVQTFSFVLIGNLVLGIRGMTLSFWLVLFTTSCSANLLGLNLSSAFQSVVTIYILIPFIIIPNMLLSGVMIKFDHLHLGNNTTREYTPVIGDLMIARWSYEALAVQLFRNNAYEKNIFSNNMKASENYYYGAFLINNGLKKDLQTCKRFNDNAEYQGVISGSFKRLNFHINELSALSDIEYGSWKDSLNSSLFNSEVERSAGRFLDTMYYYFMNRYNMISSETDSLLNKMSPEELVALRDNHENIRLKTLVLDLDNIQQTVETPKKYIRKFKPGYMKAASKHGRAHYYAPYKYLVNMELSTFWFNILLIWMVGILLYAVLYFNLLRKLMDSIENIHFAASEAVS